MMKTLLLALLSIMLPLTAAAEPPNYRYGAPIVHQNLTLVPVYAPPNTPAFTEQYLTFTEAAAEGLIKVTELDGNTSSAQVAAVHVTSTTDKPIFLMAGEVILGGKQDRIISSNTIVPARARKLTVAVFCVEQGRWDGKQASFTASGKVGHSKLRSKAMFENEQSAVWSEVAEQNKKTGTSPSTGTYRATLDHKALAAASQTYVAALLPPLSADTRALGVVVAIDGQIKSMDVFANELLFAKMREPLVESYAVAAASSETKNNAKLDPAELATLNQRLADTQNAAPKPRSSGAADTAYSATPNAKSAVTTSKDGKTVHRFMTVE